MSSASRGTATSVPATAVTTENARSPGCGGDAVEGVGDGQQAREQTREETSTLRFGGLDRSYVVHLPPAYDGASALPLVLNFHGYGGNARTQAAYSRLPQKADEEGFIVVSPNATGGARQQQWNNQQLAGRADDIGFVRVLLDRLESDYCIDRSMVFAAGISNGSAFAQRVACVMPERIIAVAAVAALVYPASCGADLPIAIEAFHGTEDGCVPYGGGRTTCGPRPLPVPPVEDAALDWARHNGCNPRASFRRLADDVRTIAYSECDGETAVVLFVIEGGGHTWPGSADVSRMGEGTTRSIDATEEMWGFFVAQAALR